MFPIVANEISLRSTSTGIDWLCDFNRWPFSASVLKSGGDGVTWCVREMKSIASWREKFAQIQSMDFDETGIFLKVGTNLDLR